MCPPLQSPLLRISQTPLLSGLSARLLRALKLREPVPCLPNAESERPTKDNRKGHSSHARSLSRILPSTCDTVLHDIGTSTNAFDSSQRRSTHPKRQNLAPFAIPQRSYALRSIVGSGFPLSMCATVVSLHHVRFHNTYSTSSPSPLPLFTTSMSITDATTLCCTPISRTEMRLFPFPMVNVLLLPEHSPPLLALTEISRNLIRE